MKIALYSCNFGNYRNEFSNYFDAILDNNFDYFLFTDRELNDIEKEKLSNWKIYKINLLPSDDIMDSYRWTSKYIKFILPNELKDYDIIIWSDNKKIKYIKNIGINYENIIKLLDKYPKDSIFNLEHNYRKTIQDEIITTINSKFENKIPGEIFYEIMKDYKSNFNLVDTCLIIRKNNQQINDVFKYCFDLLKEHKLKRDQNIYNYGLDNKKIKPVLLKFFKPFENL